MKRWAFVCVILLNLVVVCEGWGVPPLPQTFYGTVKKDGGNVPDGTQVTAWIGGVQFGSTATFASGGNSVYTFNIPGDDTETPAKEGGVNGETVSFKAGNDSARETATYVSGGITSLDLTIVGQYNLTTSVNPTGSGSVARNPNKSTYAYGDQVTLTAAPNAGYSFGSWSGDASGTGNPVAVTMSGNKAVVATFTQIPPAQYSLTVNISGSGTVTKNPNKSTYNQGETVTLTATPGSGYTFSNWSGDATGTANPVTVTMSGNKTVTATFTQNQYTLNVNTVGTGTVSKNPNKGTYVYGDTVQLTAAPGSGWAFSAWGGDASGTSNPVTVTMNGNKTVTATFTENPPAQYSLTVIVSGSGSVAKNPNKTTYNQGETVTLTATPGSGYTFSNWSGDASGTSNPVTVTMNGNKTVTATFTENPSAQYNLTVNISGSGSVAKNPNKTTYNQGEAVTLTATPGSGYTFSNWSGDASGTSNPVTVTMNGNKAVVANFTAFNSVLVVTPAVNLSASGTQGGPFNPSSQSYTLENKGNASLNWGASKTKGWIDLSSTGGSLAAGASTTLTVSINKNANALGAGSYDDTVVFTNLTNGNGNTTRKAVLGVFLVNTGYTVTTDPPGLYVTVDGSNNKSPQAFDWIPGSSHSVSVLSPQYGPYGIQYAFRAWSDGGSQSHTMVASSSTKTYVAFFDIQHSLTTFVSPGNGGTSSPSGVNWFNQGESVSISATPSTGYTFSGWSGDISGTMNPAFIVMDGPKIVTANFLGNPCSLVVNVSGLGAVTKDPDKSVYAFGDQVVLTARPNDGNVFKNWAGDVTGQGNPVILTLKGNISVTANFAPSGSLDVSPSEGVNFSFRQGVASDTLGQTYTLQNRAGGPTQWKVAQKPKWIAVSPSSGTLGPGERVQITVSLGNTVKQLKAGVYNDTINFGNTSDANDSVSRSVSLTVKPAIKSYVVKTDPDGLQVVVDGSAYISPKTFEWEVGSSHSIEVPSPQADNSPGTRYMFTAWSDRKSQSHTVNAPPQGKVFIAKFKAQHALSTSAESPSQGDVSPSGTNWYNHRQRVSVTAKPAEGNQFTGWSGDFSGTLNPMRLTIDRPINLVANFGTKGSQSASDESETDDRPEANLPMIGELESPLAGGRVLGLKTIYGWALDEEGIARVKLFVDGEYACDIPYGGLTEHLKEAYPDYPNAEKGGFALVWNYSSLSPGPHLVEVEIVSVRGTTLKSAANVVVLQLPGEMLSQVSPNGWLIQGVNLTVDGKTGTYDLRLEWSNESQAFEIVDLYPH